MFLISNQLFKYNLKGTFALLKYKYIKYKNKYISKKTKLSLHQTIENLPENLLRNLPRKLHRNLPTVTKYKFSYKLLPGIIF